MEPIDVIILISAIGIVAAVIALSIVRKKQGKSSIGCNCSSCNGKCGACASKMAEKTVHTAETND